MSIGSKAEISSWVDVTPRALDKHLDLLVRDGRGYDLKASVRAYCRHIRSIAAGHGTEAEAADLAKERALLAREQREGQALRNAQSRNELVRADEAQAEWEDILSMIRANMLTVPVVAQQRLPHLSKHDAHVLGEVVRDLLTRSADDEGPEFEDAEEEGASGAEAA